MPTPTPTYDEIAKVFPNAPSREAWEQMPDFMKGVYFEQLSNLKTVDNASKGTPIPTRTKTPTPVPTSSKTPVKTPTATPTPGGFAYLMDPETQKVKKVPWAEVADLIKAGWQEVD